MRQIIAVVLSFITGIGGHYVNRRRDKAILFFGLIVFWSVGVYVSMTLYASQIVGLDDFDKLQAAIRKYWKLPIIGLVLIWLSSIVVTYRDSNKSFDHKNRPWSVAQLFRASLLSIASAIILFYQVWMLSHWVSLPEEIAATGDKSTVPQFVEKMTNEILFPLGDRQPRDLKFRKLPVGNGFFSGKIELQGSPFANLTIQLTLNSVFKSNTVKTDSEGVFVLKMPAGLWHLNAIAVETWQEDIHAEQYTLVAQNRHFDINDINGERYDGVNILATDEGDLVPFLFSIQPRLNMLWPKAVNRIQKGSVESSVIRWEAFPGAEEYLVTIKGKPKGGKSELYFDLLTRRLQQTELSFKQLTHIDVEKSDIVYKVTVFALREDGSVLTNTGSPVTEHIFELTDNKLILGEIPVSVSEEKEEPLCSAEQLLVLDQNQQKLQAVATLIQNGLLTEAGNMLSQINGLTLPGHRERMMGYYNAEKGDCDKANQLFNQARNKNPGLEIPQAYRQKCMPLQ